MAIIALHSAATGLSGLSTELDVIANNLANVNTTGFKASRVNFEDLMYQVKSQPGVENAAGDQRPAGIQVGLGTRISNTQYDFRVGSPLQTGQPLDVFIEGNGFFRVNTASDPGVGYTRAGNFVRNSEGDLVLGTQDGPRLDPNINVPEGADRISIMADGRITAFLDGDTAETELGQLELVSFVNPAGLVSIGGNIYVESPASGAPIPGNPGEGVVGTIMQSFLESSNVGPVNELVSLIKSQRAFELNSQTIQAADETLSVVSNLRR